MDILPYLFVGFVAQLVDGALGMAYGIVSTSFLLSVGISPAAASASVHAAEVVTTGLSGLSHLWHRNVRRELFLRLVLPGAAGGVLGATVLTGLPEEIIRPVVAVYLAILGLVILVKAFWGFPKEPPTRGVVPLGLAGGFLDAVGGGGWGPIVVSTLLARGSHPRYVIGSVNLAEFFVTTAISAAFISQIGLDHLTIVLGLLLGGALAAPFAGFLAKTLPARLLMVLVALVVVGLSGYTLWRALA